MVQAWEPLSREEYEAVWDRFYREFAFRPSVDAASFPGIVEPVPSITWSLQRAPWTQEGEMSCTIGSWPPSGRARWARKPSTHSIGNTPVIGCARMYRSRSGQSLCSPTATTPSSCPETSPGECLGTPGNGRCAALARHSSMPLQQPICPTCWPVWCAATNGRVRWLHRAERVKRARRRMLVT